MSKLPKFYQQFKKSHAKVWKAYDKLGAAAADEGPLDSKTRELIKLGMAAAAKSESAVQSHTHRALEAGATPEEIEHAVVLGVTTLGFPAMMTALAWVQSALNAHAD
jgi:AhpD family alkylhydroperoxidase